MPSSAVTHEVILEPLPLGDSRRWASFIISYFGYLGDLHTYCTYNTILRISVSILFYQLVFNLLYLMLCCSYSSSVSPSSSSLTVSDSDIQ